jgi:Ca-activated chloride channel homolog
MRNHYRFIAFIVGLLLIIVAGGCGALGGREMTVLAGSELQDLEPLLDEIEDETGVRLSFEYIGTLDGAEKLMAGEEYDLAWFSHGKYLDLLQAGRDLIVTQEKTMLSPVVMGIKESKARDFGWLDNPSVTWQDIADKAASGDLRYAMTNPAASNSGFTALVGVAAALSGSSDALETGDVDSQAMQQFFKGQTLTAGSSGWLAESYVEDQDELDGLVNYESILLSLNEGGQLREKLTLIYPQDGIITADYPLMLLNSDKRDQYDELVDFLRSPAFQKEVMETTLRRPAVPGVPLDPRIPDPLLIELPFPGTIQVVDSLIFAYLDEQRVPAHAFFVLDTSGSMHGEGLTDLQTAMTDLTGLDESITGQFARFRAREKVSVISFSDVIRPPSNFVIDDTAPAGSDMAQIRDYVNSLRANGDTAIYSALQEAYAQAAAAQQADPDRYYTIVLMSDGENTAGIALADFERYYRSLPAEAQNIRVFTVLFGEANEEAMAEIAELTGGRMFDGTQEDLSFIFKQIRGYQ